MADTERSGAGNGASPYAVIAVLGVALFWLGVFTAGARIPGYDHRTDYISSLASRGSSAAAIGIAAIASMGVAYLAAAGCVWRAWARRSVAGALALAGCAHFVIAAFRIRCPLGAAGCRFTDGPTVYDAFDVIHRDGVLAFELFLLIAVLLLALGALRGAPWPRWLGAVSVAMGIASAVLLSRTGGANNGLWQRAWAADNSAWLLLVVGLAWRGRGRPPHPPSE